MTDPKDQNPKPAQKAAKAQKKQAQPKGKKGSPKREAPKRRAGQRQATNGQGRSVAAPASPAAKPRSSFRIANGDLDDLRAKAERGVARNAATKKQAKQKPPPPTERKCRECLRTKPAKAFPSRVAVCSQCGGQPRSNTVRTISGGLPTTGRRR